jgi:hypothetical protein
MQNIKYLWNEYQSNLLVAYCLELVRSVDKLFTYRCCKLGDDNYIAYTEAETHGDVDDDAVVLAY